MNVSLVKRPECKSDSYLPDIQEFRNKDHFNIDSFWPG